MSEFLDILKYFEEENKKETEKSQNNVEIEKKNYDDLKEIYSDTSFNVGKQSSEGFDILKFESLMRNNLIESNKKQQNYERPYISVTELCGCLRKSYFFRLKYKGEFNFSFPYLDLINHVGNAVHKYVLPLYGYDDIEKTIKSEKYKVKGRVDGTKDKRIVVDLKTEDYEKFIKRGTYKIEHKKQCSIYAYILNEDYGYNIDTITIIYAFRNLRDFAPFDLNVDNKLAKSLLEGGLHLQDCISKRKLIEPINSSKEECQYCPYKKLCKKQKEDKKEEITDEKKKPVFLL